MSAALIGAVIGLVLAVVELFVLRTVAERVSMPETKKALNVAGLAQLVLFPVIGWFLGDYVAG